MSKDSLNRRSLPDDASDSTMARRYFMSAPAKALAGFSVRNPIPALAIVLFLTLLSLFFAFCYLKTIPANFNGVHNNASCLGRLSNAFDSEVDDPVEACIVVEQRDLSTTHIELTKAIDSIVAELLQRPELFKLHSTKLDGNSFKTNRAYLYSPEETKRLNELLDTSRKLQRGDWSVVAIDSMANQLSERVNYELAHGIDDHETIEELLTYGRALVEATSPETKSAESMLSPILNDKATMIPELLKPDYAFSFESSLARIGIVSFSFEGDLSESELRQAVHVVEEIVERVQDNNSRTYIEASGLPFLEKSELNSFMTAGRAGVVFLIASVSIFFWAFFGRVTRAIVALATLLTSICWTTGFQTLVFRDATPDNVVSWMVVICIAIHSIAVFLARYHRELNDGKSASDALMATSTTIGASLFSYVVVLGLTLTLFAFASAMIFELFVVIAFGAVVDVIVVLLVLPAAFKLIDGFRPFRRSSNFSVLELEKEQTNPFIRTIAIATMCLVGVTCIGLTRFHFDPTRTPFHERLFENLRSQEVASRFLVNRALYATFFPATPEEGRRIVSILSEDPQLYVDDIASMIPQATPDDVARVDGYRMILSGLKPEIGAIPVPTRVELVNSLTNLRAAVSGALTSRGAESEFLEDLNVVLEQIESLSDEELDRRVGALSRLAAVSLLDRLHSFYEECDSRVPTLDDLSATLKNRYICKNSGRAIIRVYSLRMLSKSQNLKNFVRTLREVDPNVTGPAILTFERGRLVVKIVGGFLVILTGVFAVMAYLRFRFIKAPLAIVVFVLFLLLEILGIFGLIGTGINPINWLVFPCLLLLAFYGALRFAECYDEDDSRFFSGEHVLATTSTGTIIAGIFSCGYVCVEQGWQSLARVGILACAAYVATAIVLLPAILNWSAIKREKNRFGDGLDEHEAVAISSRVNDDKVANE